MIEAGAHPALGNAGPSAPPPVVDTSQVRDELDCPLCGYSLRGLSGATEPRCPECGYAFTWEELLRARLRGRQDLFEHHPRRPIRSFLRTLLAGLLPRRFWSALHAGHEVRPGWLVTYAACAAVLTALSVPAGRYAGYALALYWQDLSWHRLRLHGWAALVPYSSFFDRVWDAARDDGGMTPYLVAACVAWPWVTLGALLVFRVSMRRGRVRAAHVMRCVVYSGDAFVWCVVPLALAGPITGFRAYDDYGEPQRVALCLLLVLVVASYRLGQAYRLYLRFDHPRATVLASQVMFLLTVGLALALFCPGFWQLVW